MRRITGLVVTGILVACSIFMGCKDDKDENKDKGTVSDGSTTQFDGTTPGIEGSTPMYDSSTPTYDGNTPGSDYKAPARDLGPRPDISALPDAYGSTPNTGAQCLLLDPHCPSTQDECLSVGSGAVGHLGMCLIKCTRTEGNPTANDQACPEGAAGEKSTCALQFQQTGKPVEWRCGYECTNGEKCPDKSTCVASPQGGKFCQQAS